MTAADTSAPDDVTERQCARCRLMFPVEPGTHAMELIGWWTCDGCTESLLPDRHRTTAAAATSTTDST